MKLRETAIICRNNNQSGKYTYYASIPEHMFDALNCSPLSNHKGRQKFRNVWLGFLDYSLVYGESIPNRFRIIVLPYNPNPSRAQDVELDKMFYLQARMVNKKYALYCLSWVLGEIFAINLVSCTGIDALDEHGYLEAVVRIDKEVAEERYSPANIPGLGYLERSINWFISKLGEKETNGKGINNAKELVKLFEDSEHLGENNRNISHKTTEANMQDAFDSWQKIPDSYKPITNLIPEFLKTSANEEDLPKKYICLQPCFTNSDKKAFKKVIEGNFIDRLPDDVKKVKTSPNKRSVWLEICPSLLKGTAGSKLKNDYLPTKEKSFSYATLGLDPISGTLSIYPKAVTEVIPTFFLTLTPTMACALAPICEEFGDLGLDLRTIAHRFSVSNGQDRQLVELSADISNSPLSLIDDDMINSFINNILAEIKSDIKISWPYILPNKRNEKKVTVSCTCSRKGKVFLKKKDCTNYYFRRHCKTAFDELNNKEILLRSKCFKHRRKFYAAYATKFRSEYTQCAVFERAEPQDDYTIDHFCHKGPLCSSEAAALFHAKKVTVESLKQEYGNQLFAKNLALESKIDAPLPAYEHIVIPVTNDKDTHHSVKWGKILGAGVNGKVIKAKLTPNIDNMKNDWVVKLPNPEVKLAELLGILNKLPPNTAPFSKVFRYTDTNEAGTQNQGIIMERLEGFSLDKLFMEKSASVNLEDVFVVLERVAELILKWSNYSHDQSKGVIHLDIKPANVFMLDDGSIRFIDLGLIGLIDQDGACVRNTSLELHTKPHVFGTLYHVPPEIINGHHTTTKTPIYQWGALSCCLLGDGNWLQYINHNAKLLTKSQCDYKEHIRAEFAPSLPPWVKHAFPKFTELIELCIDADPKRRLSPQALVDMLNNASNLI